jgi:hypothetical protein
VPDDPEETKKHFAEMIEEIKQLKEDLLRVVDILDHTHMWVGLEGYAWTFGVKILDIILGEGSVRAEGSPNCYI